MAWSRVRWRRWWGLFFLEVSLLVVEEARVDFAMMLVDEVVMAAAMCCGVAFGVAVLVVFPAWVREVSFGVGHR